MGRRSPAGHDRKGSGAVTARGQCFSLLNDVGIHVYPGQDEPGVMRHFDMLDFGRIAVRTDMAKSQFDRAGDRQFRGISHAAAEKSISYLNPHRNRAK